MSVLAGLWDVVVTAGGSVALSLIVALALGLAALIVFFFGSSVIVLERFARARHRPVPLTLLAVGWAVVVAAVGLESADPEVVVASPWQALSSFASLLLRVLISMVVALLLTALVLRFVRPRALGRATLFLLGLGYALAVGGLAQARFAAAPLVLCGLVFSALLVLRRARGTPTGEVEALLVPLGLGLLPGLPLALALGGASPGVSAAGWGLLGFFAALVLLGLLPLAASGFLASRGHAEWFIAARYLVAKRRQTFISVITLICVGGVAVGVWLMVTVLSVMNGFERLWRDEIIGNRAHFTVHSGLGPFEDYMGVLDRVEQVPGVVAATPYLDAEGMVRGPAGEIVGVRIHGVDPARVGDVTDLREDLISGSIAALGGSDGEDPGILIGSRLAGGLALEVGDPVLVISPFGGPPTPLGPGPRLSRFRVAGIFQSSFFQYDQIYTFVHLSAAQNFRRSSDVAEGIEVRAEDPYRSGRIAREVEGELGFPYFTRDWKEFFPAFFQALKNERVMMFILLTMIMVVAAFIIVATLVMMIMEKSSDIAILKAMGASDATVERIFAIEGTLIGLVGTGLGIVAGFAVTTQLNWVRDQIELLTGIDALPPSVYQFSNFPREFDVLQIAVVAVVAMVLAMGATLLPSRQGARIDPAEALRYE